MLSAAPVVDMRPVARLLKALGDENRLRIVALLAHGELCVCHLEEALGLSQPNASRQLAVLRAAGVVDSRKEGTWVYYRLAVQPDRERRRQLGAVLRSLGPSEVLRRQVERLKRRKGPRACR